MPSAIVHRISTTTPTISSSAAAKHRSLPPALIKELSLHSPSLLNHAPETLHRFHSQRVGPGQASSVVVRRIDAPADAVWSVVRRFDNPLAYKRFLKSCRVVGGDGGIGTLREVRVVSGIPAAWSTERLDVIDDERRVIGFSVVGGEHRLMNYRSVMTLHEVVDGGGGTVVVESYAVDVPVGNTREETCAFVDTIVRCNLNSLAEIAAGKLTRISHVS